MNAAFKRAFISLQVVLELFEFSRAAADDPGKLISHTEQRSPPTACHPPPRAIYLHGFDQCFCSSENKQTNQQTLGCACVDRIKE